MKFYSTILDALNHHASETPDKLVFTWVNIKCEEENKMSFQQLEEQSNAVAARLLKLGCKKGDRVMVAYPFGLEFLAAMFGAMKVGVIPCSIYPPNPNQLKSDMPKFRRFAEDAGAKYALTAATFATAMTAASVLYKTGVKWIGTDKLTIKKRKPNKPKEYEKSKGEPNEVCFIQYTSGSTGRPKGVLITHHSLVETCKAGISLTDLNTDSVAALWVPQYHDMGLTGFMSCLYTGSQLVVASPLDFIAKPLLWTDMVETYKATHTSAPNFAYALLLKRLEQANRKSHWSCMKAAMFGGEPAQSHVVEAVVKTLSIKPEQVYNIYGMAEMVVFVTGGPAKTDSEEGLVSCGIVDSPSLKIRIVEDAQEVEDGQVGSIWAQSPRVTAGYYGQAELTKATFSNFLSGYEGLWLDTGDLGKIVNGQVYVTGRVKDIIIINGKNYYPTDVELSIDETFGNVIRPGRTSAFQLGDDSIGITVEGRKGFDKLANKDLAVQIANHVSQVHGLLVSDAAVLKLGVTPKTTSGKLKRNEIRQTTVGGDWKASDVLLRFQGQANMSPIQGNESPFEKSSFLEHSFAMNGVTSSEFYLTEETNNAIRRRSMTLPFGSFDIGSVPEMMKESTGSLDCNLEVQPHIAVVGGGVAGLITALRLAQRKIKVTVFERNERIGGHARHTTVLGHERNPAFGMFLGSAWPNLMALTKELGVDLVPLATAREFRDVVGMGTANIPEADPAEVSRFLAKMHIVYKSGIGQEESIGQYMARNGFDHHFVVSYFLGRMITFFPGNTIQQFLDYPLDLVAWYVIAIGMSTLDEMVFRLRNKEYMAAFEQRLLSLGVDFKFGCSPSIICRDKGVSISTGTGVNDILQFDKLVLAVPPVAALQVLASFASDTDNKTPVYATHAYATFNELEFATPTETMSFTHTRVTCKAIRLRKSLLQHQGTHSTYFAGGWTRGLMLHEDAVVSGILAANSILHELAEGPHPILERTIASSDEKTNGAFNAETDIDLSQTNTLPSKAVEAVHAVECNPSKLDEYFLELHLSGVYGIDKAWSKAIKTTASMQAMCSQIMKHLEDKHPTICQLANGLVANPEWILIDDLTDFLVQIVHQIFVLQWVTTYMMDNPECMLQKLQNDTEWESMSQSILTVPAELQEVLDLPEKDSMYGNLPFFTWIKNRSVRTLLNMMIQKSLNPATHMQLERINNLFNINVLEAVWLEQSNGLNDNSEVGRILATYPILTATTRSKMVLFEQSTSAWNDHYIAWNMHLVSWIGDPDSSTWLVSKLLLPSLVGDADAAFLYSRFTSLYLVSHSMGRRMSSSKHYTKSILSRSALQVFGKLNLSWARRLGHTPLSTRFKVETAPNESYWLSKFDQWGKMNNAKVDADTLDTNDPFSAGEATDPACLSTRYTNTIISVFGSEVDSSKTWVENGITSLKSAEIRNKVEEQMHVVLPPNFAQLFATPKDLEAFLVTSEGRHFPTKAADEHFDFHWNSPRSQCSKIEMAIVQVLGFLGITLVMLIAILPCYLVSARLAIMCSISEDQECLKTRFLWFPLLIPLFAFSFSIMVVVCKVLVVGKYRPEEINLMSWDYLRWWFVDRLMHIWELFVGRFLLETKFAWLFFWLLGAHLAWSARIGAFIRECDLVSVGANSSVGHTIRCRKFRPWTEGSPRMVFRPVIVGPNCKVSGMLSPGAVIGAGSIVEKLTVVEEGAQVPDGVIARGIPAHKAGSCNRPESNWWNETLLDAFKVFWMFSEAYHYYALYFLAHAILKEILPAWRYAGILLWFLLFPLASLFAMVTSVVLKWLLIGKRDPSEAYQGTLWRRATNWACDYHYQIASWMLVKFFGGSRLDSLILWFHGLDVDALSFLRTASQICPPSKVDFVRIRQSSLRSTQIELDTPTGERIEVWKSSLGKDTIIHAGAKVVRSNIPSRTRVSDKIYDLNSTDTELKLTWDLVLPETLQLVLLVVIFWSIAPAYEFAAAFVGGDCLTSVVILVVGMAIVFQFFVWILFAKILEWAFLNLVPPSFQKGLFPAYVSYMVSFREGNPMEFLLMGTPLFKYYAQCMGAEVNGDLWFFDCTIDEFSNCHFQGNTIVDNSCPRGHYYDFNGLTLDHIYINGVVHPGCYIAAGAVVNEEENGPWKSFFRTDFERHIAGHSKEVMEETDKTC
ncbi:D-alanine--D-alanyl carrier protein ligase [Seminavis robusta]|uniref:D-alanine--D-alanyl carrier protein ligase n=1 Tax=Seminavis robusta TaxID=568900 RepID=A0A9N8HFH5_9STRA|nr:D-alanine--D-alanyl carrier protein ligase [Seminavis robusta]|eukprot:Sro571_g168700.1 D-alanine--D-alanyl carrier protein ligase (2155) ;mRNA; r:37209-44105